MYCRNCGLLNPNNVMYCTNCGALITSGQELGSITIIRPSSFVGCLVAYDVFVDNYLLGQVKNGETKQFPLYFGTHNVVIKQGFNSGSQMIFINNEQRHLVFNCPLNMGLVTCKISFNLISCSK